MGGIRPVTGQSVATAGDKCRRLSPRTVALAWRPDGRLASPAVVKATLAFLLLVAGCAPMSVSYQECGTVGNVRLQAVDDQGCNDALRSMGILPNYGKPGTAPPTPAPARPLQEVKARTVKLQQGMSPKQVLGILGRSASGS
jgi:hypothetical protein